ncbi:MAG: hypothetical protein LiPW15_591 [Parcubacteria group bacterium LiPW_15]|nr:MAG: hypothetical protein LiPW15_591 [Parcubacteria group bacterium LiPW_15]
MEPYGFFERIGTGAFAAAFVGLATRDWRFGVATFFAAFLVDMWIENVVEAIRSTKK